MQTIIDKVLAENRIYEGWFYPPIVQLGAVKNSLVAPLKPLVSPTIPTTRFQLPVTHHLSHSISDSEEKIHFLIASLGLLLGMRLLPEGWGHFYRTPVDEHKLCDLIVTPSDVEHCLNCFDNFWDRESEELRGILLSAINSFQMAQCYTHQFEKFLLQYITLDTIYLAFLRKGWVGITRHGARPKAICQYLNIELPDWAETDSRGNSQISNVRNNLFHEGNIDGGPIGFGLIRPSVMMLSLKALNMRAILLLLGVNEPYTHSTVTSREMHGLR
jgi:hypothetical protein